MLDRFKADRVRLDPKDLYSILSSNAGLQWPLSEAVTRRLPTYPWIILSTDNVVFAVHIENEKVMRRTQSDGSSELLTPDNLESPTRWTHWDKPAYVRMRKLVEAVYRFKQLYEDTKDRYTRPHQERLREILERAYEAGQTGVDKEETLKHLIDLYYN